MLLNMIKMLNKIRFHKFLPSCGTGFLSAIALAKLEALFRDFKYISVRLLKKMKVCCDSYCSKKLIRYVIDERLYRTEKYSPYYIQYTCTANREKLAPCHFLSLISPSFLAGVFKAWQTKINLFLINKFQSNITVSGRIKDGTKFESVYGQKKTRVQWATLLTRATIYIIKSALRNHIQNIWTM